MKRLLITLVLSPLAVGHASPPAPDSLLCRVHDLGMEAHAAGKRLADLNVGEPRTVRLFHFLPNDRHLRPSVVQGMRDDILRIQAWYGEQMEAHGYGYRTFRIETDDRGDPLVHLVDGQHPDINYLRGTWALREEIAEVYDLSGNIHVYVIDNSTNRIDLVNRGEAGRRDKQSGAALVAADVPWQTMAHELGHVFGLDHDFHDDTYIMSYGDFYRNALSPCSAEFLSVHPYFNPDVGVEEAEGPAIEVLSPPTYPEGSESVPIQLRVHDPDGLHQVRLIVPTRDTHSISAGGVELKACRALMGVEALVEVDYDGVIPSGSAYGFSDLSNPRVHRIQAEAVDELGNVGKWGFQLWQVSRQHLATLDVVGAVPSVAFSPDGGALATGSGQGVRLWNPETRTVTEALSGGTTVVAWSHQGATLAIGSGRQAQLWDLTSGRQVALPTEHTREIHSLAFSPDGAMLASGAPDAIRLWDLATRTSTAALPVGASSVAFSPDGATLASGSEDGVRLWDVETQTETAAYQHSGDRWGPRVSSVAFSPDGTLVASGGWDTTVRLWDVASDESVAVLEGHGRPVRSVSFSGDGTLLASGADLVVNLWDPAARESLVALQGEGREITTVAFSPDGTTLAAGGEDGKVGLWDVSEWQAPRPNRLVVVSGDAQQGASGELLADPLVVEVRDQYGNPLPGVEITFAVTEGDGRVGGRFTEERKTSDASGRVATILALGTVPGRNVVEVSVPGVDAVSLLADGLGEPETPTMEGDWRTWHLPDSAIIRLGKGRIQDIAYSPSGNVVAVGTFAGIWLYEVATSREVAFQPTRRIWDVAFSHDGRILASCGNYKDPIRLWEVDTGEEIGVIDYQATALAFSPDGRTLASGSDFGIEFWDVDTRTQKAAMSTAEGTWGIHSVAFSPDGETLVAGSWLDNSVQLWDVETATKIATLEGHGSEVNSVYFSPDGKTVASASDDHTVRLWDVATQSIVTTFEGHGSWVTSVAFSPNGAFLASTSTDLRLWEIATGNATILSQDHSAVIGSVAFAPDGRTLASLTDGEVTVWEVASRNGVTLASGHGGSGALALSPDGTMLAAGADYDEVHLWDVATGRVTAALRGHTGRLNDVAFSADGATLASGASDQTIKLWDVATGAEIATLETSGFRAWVSAVTFSRDGTMIASGHGNGTARVWGLATGEVVATLEGGHVQAIGSLALSPDGSRLATGGIGGRFGLWDLASGTNLLPPAELGHEIWVSFDEAGTALAFGADFNTQTSSIWGVPSDGDAATLAVQYDSPDGPTLFSPDGSIFITGTLVGTGPWPNTNIVEVRDLATAGLIATLEGHGEQINTLTVSSDGSTFASGAGDGTVLVWDLERVLPHPRSLTEVSGANQEGSPNEALPRPFVIEVRDQHGAPLEGAEVTFAVTAGGGTLSVETDTTNFRGRAAVTLTLGLAPGPNTVEVTVGDLEPVIFTARTQSIPTTLGIVGGDDQQGASGASLDEPLVVSVLDQAGSPYAGATVAFSVTAGEGTLSVTRATTDAEGRATTTLTLGRTPGANSVEVTVAGLAPVTFTALGVAVPRTVTRLSGDEQAAEPGEELAEPLVVSVRDQNGTAFAGAVVTFALLGEGGTLSALTDTTDAEGRASTALTLGEEFGTYTVVATVAGLEPLTFTAAARADPDFDDDGEVALSDFFLFAEAFGGSDPRFDLDGSGEVDFADFFLFAENFGQPARAKLVALARELIGLPDGPQLRQNAPNPFNSGTVISWFQLQPGKARVEVFAVTGQRVAVLHEGPRKAGLHRLRWDGRDDRGRLLASGVYVYRLVTAEAVQTRKLTLLR